MFKKIAVICAATLTLALGVIASQSPASSAPVAGVAIAQSEMGAQLGACCGVGTLSAGACERAHEHCRQAWQVVSPLGIPIPWGCENTEWDSGCDNESSVNSNGTGTSTVTTINCAGTYSIGNCSATLLLFCTTDAATPGNSNIPCGTKSSATAC
jgi:hypothetical protein